jgi:translation initiation factor IF-2
MRSLSVWPAVCSAALAVAALAVTGCGDRGGGRAAAPVAAPAPKIARPVARRLAAEADAVALRAAQGDRCSAHEHVLALQADVTRSAPELPPALRRPVVAATRRLVATLPACPPPAPAVHAAPVAAPAPRPKPKPKKEKPPKPEHERHGHGHGHGHGGGRRDEGGD